MFRLVLLVPVFLGVNLLTPTSVHGDFRTTGVPAYDAAVQRAVEFLKSQSKFAHKEKSLVAYSLFKAGEPTDSPLVQQGIEAAVERATQTGYTSYDHLYFAGVDAMLLEGVDSARYFDALQNIANHVHSVARGDGAFSDSMTAPADTSMTQYALLALWAAQRAGCEVHPEIFDRSAIWHADHHNRDGGFAYRPGEKIGDGKGASTHTMTMAAAGSQGLSRLLLYGLEKKAKDVSRPKFGVLEKVELDPIKSTGVFPRYSPQVKKKTLQTSIKQALYWNEVRFQAKSTNLSRLYFYYTLERACTLNGVETINDQDWYRVYGDALLTMQAGDGSFNSFNKQNIATSFGILFFVRSTKQMMPPLYGPGTTAGIPGGLGNLYGENEKKDPIAPLDELLAAIENVDLDGLDDPAVNEVVAAVKFGSREDLIGQKQLLRKLAVGKNAEHRAVAMFALGRTGDFNLVPLLIQGLRDVNLAVNVEAELALRYISRRPTGFGLSQNPLGGDKVTSEREKLQRANEWRHQAYQLWGAWYRRVRPYETGGGLDEMELSLTKVR